MALNSSHDETVGVAVVGLGYWGPNLLRVLVEHGNAEVRWLCDLDSERTERFARRFPAARRSSDLAAVLADEAVDAVVLATPVYTHYELARRCLVAGKHTFVEKPLALTSDQADALIELAADRERVLRCGHTFLYSPPVRAVRDLIEADELGELYFVSASRVNLGLHQREVSVVWDLGPHDFSILLYWLGEVPISVRATGRDSIMPGIVDVAFVSLEFASGMIANVELSWLAPSKLRRTVLVGSKKMIVYEDGAPEAIKVFDRGVVYQDPETFGQYHLSYRTGSIVSPKLDTHEPLAAQVDDFLQAVMLGEVADDQLALARDVVRITEAADASLQSGGAQIGLETPFASAPE